MVGFSVPSVEPQRFGALGRSLAAGRAMGRYLYVKRLAEDEPVVASAPPPTSGPVPRGSPAAAPPAYPSPSCSPLRCCSVEHFVVVYVTVHQATRVVER